MQTTNSILLVRPAHFGYNSETAESNAFQSNETHQVQEIAQKALREFDMLAARLAEKGVNVCTAKDTTHPIKPDALFPNNWVSFHANGQVIIYPMLAPSRRHERREAIIHQVGKSFDVHQIVDLTMNEASGRILEGTGSMVFDHTARIAYACRSPRTEKSLFEETCSRLHYEPVFFDALDQKGGEIYHTNVMMTIGNDFAVVCLESFKHSSEKSYVMERLEASGREIIAISHTQMQSFCGNMLELAIPNKKNILALSTTAFGHLNASQKKVLEQSCELVPLNVETVERFGGGSVRCMIAEIFLPPRRASD
ncbi:MAG: arginine deiminase-related protein [Cryomorphaceae bacterium]